MDPDQKKYYELLYQEIATETFVRMYPAPILEYEQELIEGPIIDIGCGQSSILLNLDKAQRKLIAIDEEQLQLSLLKKRVIELGNSNLENWTFLKRIFPEEELPKAKYSLVILSFFLHFFSWQKCEQIAATVNEITTSNSLIYIKVHSTKHHYNQPENFDYFKHFFESKDLDALFLPEEYERIYFSDVEKLISKAEMDVGKIHTEELFKSEGITDRTEIDKQLNLVAQDNKEYYLEAIFRKK